MDKKNKACERLGYCGVNNQGSKFRVVYYKNNKNVWVEFYDHPRERITIVRTTWGDIENKSVMDIYSPSVYGVGYMGETTSMNNDGTVKESYRKWMSMLQRCYDEKFHLRQPTYVDCEVCEAWKCFANFERDYEELLNENNFPRGIKLALDKDILFKKNKLYSKETCILVPKKLNSMFKSDGSKNGLPIGVFYYKKNKTNPYQTRVRTGIIPSNHKESYRQSKYFSTPLEAFRWYKQEKEGIIKLTAIHYLTRGFITGESRLFRALMNYKVEIDD